MQIEMSKSCTHTLANGEKRAGNEREKHGRSISRRGICRNIL